jgi:hypothetical protein
MPSAPTALNGPIVVLCFVATACAQAQAVQEALTPAEMREDLAFLRDTWAAMDRSFDPEQRNAFASIVNDAIANVESFSSAEFALEVARSVATSGNGHTAAFPHPYLRFLPLRVWWFSDGLYVVRAHPDFASMLGAQVLRIGERTAEEALAQVTPYLSGNNQHRRFVSASYLVSPEALHAAGVTDSADEAALMLRMRDGQMLEVVVRPVAGGPPPDVLAPLIPPTGMERWPHVLDSVADRAASFAAPVDIAHARVGDGAIAYIRSNQTISQDGQSLHDKTIDVVHRMVRDGRPRSAVVDLRFNTGGNLYQTIVFSQMLADIIPDDGRIFVLIGNVTFSAALVTAAMLKIHGGDKTVLVGDRMGDEPRFWAEGSAVSLPNSRIHVFPAHELHDWSNGCAGEEHCFLAAEVFAQPGVSLEPDVYVPMRFAPYAAGRDEPLETVIDMAR